MGGDANRDRAAPLPGRGSRSADVVPAALRGAPTPEPVTAPGPCIIRRPPAAHPPPTPTTPFHTQRCRCPCRRRSSGGPADVRAHRPRRPPPARASLALAAALAALVAASASFVTPRPSERPGRRAVRRRRRRCCPRRCRHRRRCRRLPRRPPRRPSRARPARARIADGVASLARTAPAQRLAGDRRLRAAAAGGRGSGGEPPLDVAGRRALDAGARPGRRRGPVGRAAGRRAGDGWPDGCAGAGGQGPAAGDGAGQRGRPRLGREEGDDVEGRRVRGERVGHRPGYRRFRRPRRPPRRPVAQGLVGRRAGTRRGRGLGDGLQGRGRHGGGSRHRRRLRTPRSAGGVAGLSGRSHVRGLAGGARPGRSGALHARRHGRVARPRRDGLGQRRRDRPPSGKP